MICVYIYIFIRDVWRFPKSWGYHPCIITAVIHVATATLDPSLKNHNGCGCYTGYTPKYGWLIVLPPDHDDSYCLTTGDDKPPQMP